MAAPPVVSGITPFQGPPGMKVTLHGENLGKNENDIEMVKIGHHNCTYSLEWISSKRLKVRVGPESGLHDIVIKTRSGGMGSSTVQFRCLSMSVGPLEESAVWVEEQHFFSANQRKQSYSQPEESNEKAYGFELSNILGLADEDRTGLCEAELATLFPDKSGNLLSDNFDPLWYLLEHYQSASVEDMRRGLQYLKEAQGESTTGSVSFRKQHLQLYLESHNLMHVLLDMIKSDNADSDGVFDTTPLDKAIKKCISRADELFVGVLKRKEDADAQRLSLELINRNEFLFSLPSSIEAAMKRNEVELIISYYRRGRVEPLLAKSDSKIFRDLNAKIDSVLIKVRACLLAQLHKIPSSFEEQRRIIRYLTDLDTPGDVAWELIVRYKSYFDTEMVNIKSKFLASTAQATNSTGHPRSVDAIKPGISSDTFKLAPDKVAYISELKNTFNDTFAAFWRLGQSYFTGSLLLNETGRSAPADVSHFSAFKEKVDEVMKLYCNLIRAVFTPRSFENFPLADREKFGVWPSDFDVPTFIACVHQVRTSVLFLHRLPDPLPATAVDLIDALAVDIRRECMRFTFDQTILTVRRLNERETWLLEVCDTDGTVTELPKFFEQSVTDLVQQLAEVSNRLPTADAEQDADIFRDYLVAKEAKSWLIQLFQAFAAAIEAAYTQATNAGVQNAAVSKYYGASPDSRGIHQPSPSEAMLLCANNAHVTSVHVLPRIVELLHRRGYQLLVDIRKAACDVYDTLANRLLSKFVESRMVIDVVGRIEQRMYATTDFSWMTTVPPASPSSYVVQTLFDACAFRFHLARIAPFGLKFLMARMSEEITDEIIRLFKCVVEHNAQALVQQRLDVNVIMLVLGKWMPDQTKKAINEFLNNLRIGAEQAGRVDILIKRFSLQHALLCSSFS